ncbi:MAG: tetratricopeptide repeat protein [Chloroflexi bacterium]|nr:tetratricopeptide repeat protein [Chloroflexota bacterium]
MNVANTFSNNYQTVLSLAAQSEQAGNATSAARFYHLAAEQAAAHYANEEAFTYFKRALELTPSANIESRYYLQLGLENLYSVLGNPESRGANLTNLAALADAIDDDSKRAEVAVHLTDYKLTLGDYQNGISIARLAIRIAQFSATILEEVSLLRLWGQIYLRQGKYTQAQSKLNQAMIMAQSGSFQHEEAHCCRYLGVICEEKGKLAEAKTYYEHALTIYRVLQDIRGQSDLLANLGKVAYDQHKFSEALRLWKKAQPTYAEMGDRRGTCRLLINLSAISMDVGHYEQAKEQLENAISLSKEIGLRFGECLCGINLGLVHHYQGEHENAIMVSQQAIQLAQKIGSSRLEGFAYLTLGQVYTEMAHYEDASRMLWHAFALWNEVGHSNLAIAARSGLIRLALKQGILQDSSLHLEEILVRLKDAPTIDGAEAPFGIYLTCFYALRLLQDARADAVLAEGYLRLQACAEAINDEEMRHSFLQNVVVNRQIVIEFQT